MKVKIIKCDDNKYWYHNRIGEIFEVFKYLDQYLYDNNGIRGILKEDCIDITRELKLERILDEK